MRSRVVLPAPDPPMMTAVSRRRRCMVIPRITWVDPKFFFTSSTKMWSSGGMSGRSAIRRRGYHAGGLGRDRLTPAPRARQCLDMTDEMFRAVLETAGAKADKDGW